MVAPATLWWRLAGFLELDELGDLVLAARALINALIITLTVGKNGDERHLRATLGAPGWRDRHCCNWFRRRHVCLQRDGGTIAYQK